MPFPKARLSALLLVVAARNPTVAALTPSSTSDAPGATASCVAACVNNTAGLFGCSSPDPACVCALAEDYNTSLEGCILSACSADNGGYALCPVGISQDVIPSASSSLESTIRSTPSEIMTSSRATPPVRVSVPTGMTTITGIATATKRDAAPSTISGTNGASTAVAPRWRPGWVGAVLLVAGSIALGLVLH